MTEKTVSERTAKEYLEKVSSPITRIEYLFYLKEANDEGRVRATCDSRIETQEEFNKVDHWARFAPGLREEFYISYRAGYKAVAKGNDHENY